MMRSVYRPFAHHPFVSGAAFLLLFAAFVLLLLVAVSLPILKPVYLLSVTSTVAQQPVTSIATTLRFGVWGFCASSELHESDWFSHGLCYGPQLGYDVPPEVTSLIGVSQSIFDAVEKTLRLILVLHPIACGLSFIGFILSCFLGPHFMAIITLIISIITALATALVFGIDLALVLVTRKEISSVSEFHFDVQYGTGVWMIFASLVATILASLFLSARACYCCCVRPPEDDWEDYDIAKPIART